MNKMKYITSLFLLLICFYTTNAQPFEGTIDFSKITNGQTTNYRYYVKNEKVRIEEFDEDNRVIGVIIVDVLALNTILMNTQKKLYLELEKNNSKLALIHGADAQFTKVEKNIAGYNCQEVIVRDKKDKREVSFFVNGENFNFFKNLMIALNRKDIPSLYFQQIPNLENLFPFSAIEKDHFGTIITAFEVTKISKNVVEDSFFVVPSDYSKL
jgi:hypothetical protein